MGTVPTFPTFTPGEKPPASKLNQMADWANYMANPPKCSAYQVNAQSMASGAYPAIVLDAEVYDVVQSGDTGAHGSPNLSRIYIRTPGKYRVTAQAQIGANGTGDRAAQVRVNAAGSSTGGSLVVTNQQSPLPSISTSVFMATGGPVPFLAGDYLEMFATQNSGSTLSTIAGQGVTFLSVEWVGI